MILFVLWPSQSCSVWSIYLRSIAASFLQFGTKGIYSTYILFFGATLKKKYGIWQIQFIALIQNGQSLPQNIE